MGKVFDGAFPSAAGKGVPCDFDWLAFLQPADFGLVDKSAHADTVQVGDLHEQIAGGHKRIFANRQVVGHAGEGRRDIKIA